MFGVKFIKFQPNMYVLMYKNGRIKREGRGLSFFYYTPITSLVAIPLSSNDIPFIFEEMTGDFQKVTIQGNLTYRIVDPKKIAEKLNFTLNATAKAYESDDNEKLAGRLMNTVKVITKKQIQKLSLREAIRSTDALVDYLISMIREADEIMELGIEILSLNILCIRPIPEMERALESGIREQLLQQADEAIYARRNASVEQERAIKENELNTEIAIENKKRQIREAKMDADSAVQEKEHDLKEKETLFRIEQEKKNKELVGLTVENNKMEADAKAYGVDVLFKALANIEAPKLQALASTGMASDQLIALAFQEIAGKADKIGQLNVSPDLLSQLIRK